MKKVFESKTLTMLILFLGAAVLSLFVYPEVFVSLKTSFVFWQDYCVEYPLCFILTNFFYQGGLQLWDFFGQMPLTYTYATFGFFKLPNVMTAFVYWLLSPLSLNSSQFFHHVFAWANLGTLLFIRVAGIYLLLQTVTRNKHILRWGTVFFAVFFCQQAFMRGTFLMSYYPLALYFLVRFFQNLQMRYLAATLGLLAVVLGSGIIHGACMYLALHFVIISGIIWRLFILPKASPHQWRGAHWKKYAWIIPVGLLMVGPYLYIAKFCLADVAFGREASRIGHLLSLPFYFHQQILDLGDPVSFWSNNLNFLPYQDFVFYMGIGFFFLAVAGLILSRNSLKWIFALCILFLWLLSFPREGFNIGLIAHWINALTNPLKSLPRSYFVTTQSMLPFLMMPLAALGLEAVIEIYAGKKFPDMCIKLLCASIFLGLLGVYAALPSMVRVYLSISAVLLILGLGWVQWRNSLAARKFLVACIGVLMVIDLGLTIHQSKAYFAFVSERLPVKLDAAPQAGMVSIDFENPSIFPYRYTTPFSFSFRDELNIWNPQRVSSDFHHVIDQVLNFTFANGHDPRHAAFENWPQDEQMLHYLLKNHQFIFLADEAINASPIALERITQAGLQEQVAMVDDPGHQLNLPDQWSVRSPKKENVILTGITGPLIKVGGYPYSFNYAQGDLILLSMTLPESFPNHLTSSWFAEEGAYLHFLVEGADGKWREFQPAQGELIRPFTFDVQNIRAGTLTAAFPRDDFDGGKKFILYYPSPDNDGVTGLWKKQFDNLGINYRAGHDGWLVCHYPYDRKFKISVDDREVQYYRTNKSFIGFPLAKGEHKILIQYWPQTPLRFFIFISALLTTLGLPLLIFWALRNEEKFNE